MRRFLQYKTPISGVCWQQKKGNLQALRTIKEVFTRNLRHFRGNYTQAEVAEKAGISFRSYQNMESGQFPREANLEAVARALGVQPTALFLDPDFTLEPTPLYALEIVRRALEGFCGEHLTPMRREVLAKVAQVDESHIPAVLSLVDMALNVGPKQLEEPRRGKKSAR